MEQVPFTEPPSLNVLLAAGGGDPNVIDAPLNVRVRGSRHGHRLPAPERGFQLGFESTLGGGSLQAEDVLLEQIAGLSGRRISRADALRVPAVLRARNVIAGVPATLPIELRNRKTRELDDRQWVGEHPDPAIEPVVTYALTYEDLLFHQVSYWRVLEFAENFPLHARHVDSRSVSQHQILGMPSEIVSEDLQFTPRDPVFIDGVPVLDPRRVIRFTSPNPPLLTHAAQAIRTVLLLDEAASRFARDPAPIGYFTDDEDQTDPLDDDEIRDVLNDWEKARRNRVWGYVSKGLKLNQLQPPTPEQLQLVESRQHAVLEIARATGLDPETLGVSTTSRTYQNSTQRRQELVDFLLMSYITPVQQRLSMPDVTPREVEARVKVEAFMRADVLTRNQSNEIAVRGGWKTINEVRAEDGKPDLSADDNGLSLRELAEMIQKIYLGVDTVVTWDEARQILRKAGADLGSAEQPAQQSAEALVRRWLSEFGPAAGNGHRELMGVG